MAEPLAPAPLAPAPLPPTPLPPTPAPTRPAATARLFLGGAFAPSESGRTYPVAGTAGEPLGSAALASRKDVRDAVVAARAAFPGWAARAPYRRGRVLYRVAELLEGRGAHLAAAVAAAEGLGPAEAAEVVAAAVDRWVWYAGWADKLASVAGTVNAVPGSYVSYSLPEPCGVVGVLAPQDSSLLGLLSVLAPVLAAGAVAVVVASERRPLPAVLLAECLAVSEVPAGVVSVLTGATRELAPTLAAHGDVDALDLAGALDLSDAAEVTKSLELAAAGNLKRTYRVRESDWGPDPGLERLLFACETKCVWQPVGT